MKKTLMVLWAVLAALPSHAHYLWVERGALAGDRVFFGEYQDGLREKAGGRLDKITGLEVLAWPAKAKEPRILAWKKKEDGFDVARAPSGGVLLARDLKYEVMDLTRHGMGVVKPMFYARSEAGEGGVALQPYFNLDVLPVGGEVRVYQVFLRKAPLPEEKVMVYAPNGWAQEFKTDAEGKIKISTPWPGRYVLDVVHKEEKSGAYEGRAYEALRHRCTSVVIQPEP